MAPADYLSATTTHCIRPGQLMRKERLRMGRNETGIYRTRSCTVIRRRLCLVEQSVPQAGESVQVYLCSLRCERGILRIIRPVVRPYSLWETLNYPSESEIRLETVRHTSYKWIRIRRIFVKRHRTEILFQRRLPDVSKCSARWKQKITILEKGRWKVHTTWWFTNVGKWRVGDALKL